jgi:AcrR family transcriptional regulator
MPRPSLADVRRPQLLDAYISCLARFGLEGATMERVADEAGVTRGLVRHYLGNRDEALRAVMEYARELYLETLRTAIASAPGSRGLLDGLFASDTPRELDWAIDTLLATAERDPQIAELLREFYGALEDLIDTALEPLFPSARPRHRREVAFAILSLAAMVSDFEGIGFPKDRRLAARRAAATLLVALENPD